GYIGGSHITFYDLTVGQKNLDMFRENAGMQPEDRIDVATPPMVDLRGTWLKIKDFFLVRNSQGALNQLLLPMKNIHQSYNETRTLDDACLASSELSRVGEFCEFADFVKDIPDTDVVLGYDALDLARDRKAIAILLDGSPIAICRLRKDLYEAMRTQKEAGQDVICALEIHVIETGYSDASALYNLNLMDYWQPKLLDFMFSHYPLCVPLLAGGDCRRDIKDAMQDMLMVLSDFQTPVRSESFESPRWGRSSTIVDVLRGCYYMAHYQDLPLPYDFLMEVLGKFYPGYMTCQYDNETGHNSYYLNPITIPSDSELPGISREVVENLINKYFNQELRQKYAASIDSLKKLITGDPRMALPVLMVGYSQCLMPLKMDLFMLVDTVGTIAFGQKIVSDDNKKYRVYSLGDSFPPNVVFTNRMWSIQPCTDNNRYTIRVAKIFPTYHGVRGLDRCVDNNPNGFTGAPFTVQLRSVNGENREPGDVDLISLVYEYQIEPSNIIRNGSQAAWNEWYASQEGHQIKAGMAIAGFQTQNAELVDS
ncbi:hypothetical protein CS805_004500, partial [Escherichia coli]|nr:hypothetical protein [Escherichia coli]EJJ0330293.1 hypothetical protein [Escherichia coli]